MAYVSELIASTPYGTRWSHRMDAMLIFKNTTTKSLQPLNAK